MTAAHPNHIWGIDITYIRLQHGWLYLAAVLDWYSRYVVSWALSQTLGIDFVPAAVDNALFQAEPEIWNSDQAAALPARNIWNVCNVKKSRLAWMDTDAPWITFSQKDCGTPSSIRKFICMNILVQRRLITSSKPSLVRLLVKKSQFIIYFF
ncbi:MAG: transposase family protein [Chloroflexi bacterium]|nr:transposase family protein [Chloroflexota bacterium]